MMLEGLSGREKVRQQDTITGESQVLSLSGSKE